MSGISTQGATIRVLDTSVSPMAYDDIACVTDFQGPSGSRQVIDTTCLTSTGKEKNVGIPDFGQVTFNVIFSTTSTDNHVTSSVSLWENFVDGTSQTFRIIVPNSPEDYIQFNGYVLNFSLTSNIDDVFRAAVTLEIDGAPTASWDA